MPPRRPTAPHAGAARARAAGRAQTPARGVAARSAPAGRATGPDRPPATGRAPSRPLPGVPATGGSAGARQRPPVLRPVTMLVGTAVVLVLLLAPYVRPWVTQRSQLNAQAAELRRLQADVDHLAEQKRRWDDPAYVRAQARERLHYVMPGETGYVVVGDVPATAAPVDPRSAAAALPSGSGDRPWYGKVWDSVVVAGDPTTEQARATTVAG